MTDNKIGILSADALERELSFTAVLGPALREEDPQPAVHFFDLKPTRRNPTSTQQRKFLLDVVSQLIRDAASGLFHSTVLCINKPRRLASIKTRENIKFAGWVLEDVTMRSSLTTCGSVRIEVRIMRGGVMSRIDEVFISRNYHREQLSNGTIVYETNPIPALCEAS